MLATALIVFREVLEAALIVSILMVATRGVRHRGAWVALGIAGGIGGAAAIAGVTNILSAMFDGRGQELVNAAILFLATGLIAWHVVWMNAHGRVLAADMKAVGASVSEGEKHMSILAIVVGLAVMREGAEVVLMLQGLVASGAEGTMLGGAIGFGAGALVGALLYVGFVAMPIGRVFALTNGLLVLIAAGMAARGANMLVQAGLLPSLGQHVWDSSAIVSEQSFVGQFLAALVGYMDRPNGVEVLFYGATVAAVIALMMMAGRQAARAVPALATLVLVFAAMPAKADEVLSPYVTKGEVEFEHQGYVTHDRNPDSSNEQAYTAALGISPTDWYRAELEGEFEREAGPDHALRYTSFNIENTFQLADQGEYWIDPALFYEMEFARGAENPNAIVFGFLGAKTIGPVTETFNLLADKDYGPNAEPMKFSYSSQTKYRLRPWLEPGVEIFGDTDHHERFADQQLAMGPGLFGKIYAFDGQAVKYQLGYLFGATPATPDGAVRWKLEYEWAF